MAKNKKKAFTLIELIAVLVIMAIIVLIATPLVMNIIRKARISADKRSVDAYGRSIELAIAGYLLDTGKFPTSIGELTIEYSGDEVECETTQINSDSSVYLAGCKVKGRDVTNYTYGSDKSLTYKAYSIGDQVNYNNVDYYVIKDSSSKESTVTLLKAEPLSVAEVNLYGAGHVNRYTSASVGTAYDGNGYGIIAYYTSETCGNGESSGCKSDYASSEIKYVVDAWKQDKAPAANEARLVTIEELTDNLGYEIEEKCDPQCGPFGKKTSNTPTWVYTVGASYWTMSQYNNSTSFVWSVFGNTGYSNINSYRSNGVRPVIVLDKLVLSS